MNYLIPAGSKKQLLILGVFKPFELGLFGAGIGVTVILLILFSPSGFLLAILDLLPAVICSFLVLPIPHYHNTLTAIKELYTFFTNRQRFIWKGWCVKDVFK